MSHGRAQSHCERTLQTGMDAGEVLPVGHRWNCLPTTLMNACFRLHEMEERPEDLSTTTTTLADLVEVWSIVWDAKSFRGLVITVQMGQVLVITCQAFLQCHGHSVTFCLFLLILLPPTGFLLLSTPPILCLLMVSHAALPLCDLWPLSLLQTVDSLSLSASYSRSPWERSLSSLPWSLSSPLK